MSDLDVAIAQAEQRERGVADLIGSRAVGLPLRYWAQQAHYTTPAGDVALARKAMADGTAPMGRILERFGLEPRELASGLGIGEQRVAALLLAPRTAPMVMLDGEDAQALRTDVVDAGLANAASLLVDPDLRSGSLRFFRPPGFGLGTTARDLLRLLDAVAIEAGDGGFPLDGIIFPKLEHPEQLRLLYDHLDRAERALGVEPGTIRVGLLIESGWAVANLARLVREAVPRLASVIFGLVDYAADLGLNAIRTDHSMAEHARAAIINIAGAVGVPAIDGMTVDYPVADPSLGAAENRARLLDRMCRVYEDARHAAELGMSGKWVGHPAQLFATLLAFDEPYEAAALDTEVRKVEAYQHAVAVEGRGATIIDGVMSDRATDRHARERLRRATAVGRFPVERALALGIVSPYEIDGLSAGGVRQTAAQGPRRIGPA